MYQPSKHRFNWHYTTCELSDYVLHQCIIIMVQPTVERTVFGVVVFPCVAPFSTTKLSFVTVFTPSSLLVAWSIFSGIFFLPIKGILIHLYQPVGLSTWWSMIQFGLPALAYSPPENFVNQNVRNLFPAIWALYLTTIFTKIGVMNLLN